MQITLIGRLWIWLGVILLALGFFFSNISIAILSGVVLLFTLYDGVRVRHTYLIAQKLIESELHALNTETVTGKQVIVETILKNNLKLDLQVMRLRLEASIEIDQEAIGMGLLPRGSELRLKTTLTPRAAGILEVTGIALVLAKRPYFFTQTLHFNQKLLVSVRPSTTGWSGLTGLDTLTGLRSDPVRRGIGSDLAGIRPLTFHDDFHSIDWKATARTGKTMTKEYYLERESPMVLLVETSAFSIEAGRENSQTLLKEILNLLEDHQLSANPLGLVLCDEQNIIVQIEPSTGVASKERIAEVLLAHVSLETESAVSSRWTLKPLSTITEDIDTLERGRKSDHRLSPLAERINSFVDMLLPYLMNAKSKYFGRLRKQGIFKAFQAMSSLAEPSLVIVISNGRQNLEGLLEGANYATGIGHQVILVVPEGSELTHDETRYLREGAQLVVCTTEELWLSVNQAILDLGRTRLRHTALSSIN